MPSLVVRWKRSRGGAISSGEEVAEAGIVARGIVSDIVCSCRPDEALEVLVDTPGQKPRGGGILVRITPLKTMSEKGLYQVDALHEGWSRGRRIKESCHQTCTGKAEAVDAVIDSLLHCLVHERVSVSVTDEDTGEAVLEASVRVDA